jgi:hypothetical protein
VFDHTSIPATLKELFNLPQPLTERDRVANTLSRALKLKAPREVELTKIPRTLDTLATWDAVEFAESAVMTEREINGAVRSDKLSKRPLSDLQKSLLDSASTVTGADPGNIKTEGEGALHVRNVMRWFALGHIKTDTPENLADG